MRLSEALDQISAIQLQMTRARVFRGFRSATTLLSAGLAVVASVAQAIWLPDPAAHAVAYFVLWLSVGLFCLAVVSVGIAIRFRRSDSSLERELCLAMVQQFLPCLVTGAVVTFVLSEVSWNTLWIAPPLWSIFFGMGILASRSLLPRGAFWVGVFYLLCGLVSIEFSNEHPLSPWVMGVPFGVGQAVSAALLYWELEREHARQ